MIAMNLGHFQAIDKGSDVLTNFEKSEDIDVLEGDRGENMKAPSPGPLKVKVYLFWLKNSL